jgi:hypothetical protein
MQALIQGYKRYTDAHLWSIYLTVTFRRPVLSANAFRQFRYFFKHLNSPQAVFFRGCIRCFVVAERQGRHESVHLHCLVHGIDPLMARQLELRCRSFFGESVAKVYNYDLPKLASDYLAEKCAYGVADDWTPMVINSRYRGKDDANTPLPIQVNLPLMSEAGSHV